jgi:hypothetical protein
MPTDKPDEPRDAPRPDATPDPTPLAPGVWVTEATGFACVPPRAQSDLGDVKSCEDDKKNAEKLEKEAEPRIEKYRER